MLVTSGTLTLTSPLDIFSDEMEILTDEILNTDYQDQDIDAIIFDMPSMTFNPYTSPFYKKKISTFLLMLDRIAPNIRSLKLCQTPFPFITKMGKQIIMNPVFISSFTELRDLDIACHNAECCISLISLLLGIESCENIETLAVTAHQLFGIKYFWKQRKNALKDALSKHTEISIVQYLERVQKLLYPEVILDYKGREIDKELTKPFTVDKIKIVGIIDTSIRDNIELRWAIKSHYNTGVKINSFSFLNSRDDVVSAEEETISSLAFYM